jgi:hypothetical protein
MLDVILGVSGEVMAAVDPDYGSVRKPDADSGAVSFVGDPGLAGDPLEGVVSPGPHVVIATHEVEPRDLVSIEHMLCEPPSFSTVDCSIRKKSGEPSDPVVGDVSHVGGEYKIFTFPEKRKVALETIKITIVRVDMGIANKSQSHRSIDLDVDAK